MRPFLLAMVAMAAIAYGAYYGLERAGYSVAEKSSSQNVRLE